MNTGNILLNLYNFEIILDLIIKYYIIYSSDPLNFMLSINDEVPLS
jgi:hypothetical protein